jgi:hypothetical protein
MPTNTKKTAAKKSATTSAVARITNDMVLVAVPKKENPFTKGTVKAELAQAVIKSSGHTVGYAKDHGANTWAVRELVHMGVVKVKAMA